MSPAQRHGGVRVIGPAASEFSAALHRFCTGLCEHIASHLDDPAAARDCVGDLLDSIREAQATLLLCEFECERLLACG